MITNTAGEIKKEERKESELQILSYLPGLSTKEVLFCSCRGSIQYSAEFSIEIWGYSFFTAEIGDFVVIFCGLMSQKYDLQQDLGAVKTGVKLTQYTTIRISH